jgi:lysophospholipase L1-like esterase
MAEIEYGDTQIASIAVIGDSWTNSEYRVCEPLRGRLEAAGLTRAGAGWCSAATNDAVPTGVTRTLTGTWTLVEGAAGSLGPSVSHVVSTGINDNIVWSLASVTNWRLHYRKQVDGGTFEYRIGTGGWTVVDTNAAAAAAVIDITGADDLEINVTAQGTTGVIILGVEAYTGDTGFVVHKLGRTGSQLSTWLAVDETAWEEAITNLAPDVIVILLGTNDMAQNVTTADYADRMDTLIARIAAADPTIDILLVSPSENGLSRLHSMAQYRDVLQAYAHEQTRAYIDLWRVFGAYLDASGVSLVDRDMYGDSTHPGLRGGLLIGKQLARMFE